MRAENLQEKHVLGHSTAQIEKFPAGNFSAEPLFEYKRARKIHKQVGYSAKRLHIFRKVRSFSCF